MFMFKFRNDYKVKFKDAMFINRNEIVLIKKYLILKQKI